MAQTIEDSLVVRMEASLAKFERQMKRGREAATQAAQGSERAWSRAAPQMQANANRAAAGMSRLSKVSGSGRFVIQNTANQIGDMAVQLDTGTNSLRVMGQQIPQVLGGFGALGGSLGLLAPLLGTVAALGFPIAAAFLMAGDESETLDDRLTKLKDTIKELEAGVELLNTDIEELTEKYGEAAERVKQFALAQAEILADQAASRLKDQVDVLDELITRYISSTSEGVRFERQMQNIQEDFGVTREQALALKKQFEDLYTAGSFDQQQEALSGVLESLKEMKVPLSEIPEDLKLAVQEVINFSNATDRAVKLMADLRAEAAGMTTGVPLFDQSLEGGSLLPPAQAQDEPDDTGSSRRRRSVTAARAEEPGLFDALDGQMTKIERQIEMIGKTGSEVAALTAKYTLLDEAKKRNIDLDARQAETGETVRQQIERQSEAIGSLTEKYEQARDRAAFFDQQQQRAKDGMLDAIVEGENLAGVLEDVAKSFAKAALEAALFNSGPMAGGGSGGGLLGNILGSIFPNANGNAFSGGRVTPFANGGVVNGPTLFPMRNGAGLMGEAGPEAVMPLTRIGGKLGVQAADSGGQVVNNFKVIAPPGSDVQESRQQNSTGGEDLTVMIDRAVSGLVRDPGSNLSKTLSTGFGVGRNTRRR